MPVAQLFSASVDLFYLISGVRRIPFGIPIRRKMLAYIVFEPSSRYRRTTGRAGPLHQHFMELRARYAAPKALSGLGIATIRVPA